MKQSRSQRVAPWIAVGLTLVAMTASARPRGPAALARLEQAIPALGLDAESEEAVYAILDSTRLDQRARHEEIREAHDALRELLEQADPDPEAVLAQAEQIGALKTDARKAGLLALLEVRSYLTEEQVERLREIAENSRGDERCESRFAARSDR